MLTSLSPRVKGYCENIVAQELAKRSTADKKIPAIAAGESCPKEGKATRTNKVYNKNKLW
jgi:hypothetical protein